MNFFVQNVVIVGLNVMDSWGCDINGPRQDSRIVEVLRQEISSMSFILCRCYCRKERHYDMRRLQYRYSTRETANKKV